MRASLNALTDELRRLKAGGVKTVSVSDESLGLLRKVMTRSQSRPTLPTPAPAPSRSVEPLARPIASEVPVAVATVTPKAPPRAAAPRLPPPPSVVLPEGTMAERWEALRLRVVADPVCQASLRPGKKVVVGTGSLDAEIMFVGEAPGAEEELQGEPFVGPAGQLLTKMIGAMGLSREAVYIGNIMNWRPDLPTPPGGEQVGNRPPTDEEMAYCLPFLRAQIEVVQPKIIVALGSTAAQGLLGVGSFKALGEVRGRWHEFQGKPLMVTYHPSYILRNQSNRSKRLIWEDLLQVMDKAGLNVSDKQRSFFLVK